MSSFVLRYFFDLGSGICLWSANDAAREKFGYPVDLHDLGLPNDVLLEAVIAWYDTSTDWRSPCDASSWSGSERARFHEASRGLLCKLRQHLGPGYEILDEWS